LGRRTSPGAQKIPNPVMFRVPGFGFRVQGSGAATQELAASRAESLNFAIEAIGLPGVATAASMPNQPMTKKSPKLLRNQFCQIEFYFLGCLFAAETEPLGQPGDMRINHHPFVDARCVPKHDIGGL